MDDELDQPLMFETIAASLELDRKEARSLIESLATMLQGALPEQVIVTRGGWILSKDRPVETMLVRFEDIHYQISKEKAVATYSAKALKIVRGVTLKTTDIELSECVEKIVAELTRLAEKNSRMRDSLRKFITG